MTKTNEDTVLYHLENNAITQIYRSQWFDNCNTTVSIPNELCEFLQKTCIRLVSLGSANLAQTILGDTFHYYFDLTTAKTTKPE